MAGQMTTLTPVVTAAPNTMYDTAALLTAGGVGALLLIVLMILPILIIIWFIFYLVGD